MLAGGDPQAAAVAWDNAAVHDGGAAGPLHTPTSIPHPSSLETPPLPPLPQARDAFYECVEAAGQTFALDTPVPSQCKRERAAYEAACKASWVKHFDLLQDKRLRYLQTLRQNIAKQTQTGTGSQQGKA